MALNHICKINVFLNPQIKYIKKHRKNLTKSKNIKHIRKFKLHVNLQKTTAEQRKSINSKSQELALSELTAIGPLDGRYGQKLIELRDIFSEYALIKYRVYVEVCWFEFLQKHIKEISDFTSEAKSILNELKEDFKLEDALEVKEHEKVTNHDVKAIEYFIKERFKNCKELKEKCEFVHFGCTSEDINNLSYALMIKQGLNRNIIPCMDEIIEKLAELSEEYANVSMLSRTHGQPASTTTMGKELANFTYHLRSQREKIKDVLIMGKMAGAVGNYNAHMIAYPELDWQKITKVFIESLGLRFNPYVTQIESHHYIAEIFHGMVRFNNILIDFNRDIWTYISMNYFKQKTMKNEIGSSTMPHKVNPIDFENSEGNLGISNALYLHMASKLPISRLQRDLTDSTVLRNIGIAFGHSFLAYNSTIKGIGKLKLEEVQLEADLEDRWEILAEAVQTVMRRYNVSDPYEKLKKLTRGKKITRDILRDFIKALEIPNHIKEMLLELKPETYIGNASEQAILIKKHLE